MRFPSCDTWRWVLLPFLCVSIERQLCRVRRCFKTRICIIRQLIPVGVPHQWWGYYYTNQTCISVLSMSSVMNHTCAALIGTTVVSLTASRLQFLIKV